MNTVQNSEIQREISFKIALMRGCTKDPRLAVFAFARSSRQSNRGEGATNQPPFSLKNGPLAEKIVIQCES